MAQKKRGSLEINQRYTRIIRSMLLNNFVLSLNNNYIALDFTPRDAQDEHGVQPEGILVKFCG